jgi:hypothetical protein
LTEPRGEVGPDRLPKGCDRYLLLDFFVRTLFSRFPTLKAGPHHPKWEEVNLAATLPGLEPVSTRPALA